MDILITGITGRIGANLAAVLRSQGHSVRGLVWSKDPRVEKLDGLGVELQYGSLTEADDVRRAVDGVDAVYHLGAAFQGGGPFSEQDYFDINVRGTFLMLEEARQRGLSQLVFASTDALYAKYPPEGLEDPVIRVDDMPRQPRGWYALSKSVGEEMCNGYYRTYSLPVTILRFSMVVGAGEILDFPQFYLSKMRQNQPSLDRLWQGEERLVVLKDRRGRPFKKHIADVRDIVHGCACALGKPEAAGETFQLGGPEAFTWDAVISYLSERLEIPYVEATPDGPPTYYEYDLTKARQKIGFQPSCDINRMIDDAIAFRQGKEIGVLPTA